MRAGAAAGNASVAALRDDLERRILARRPTSISVRSPASGPATVCTSTTVTYPGRPACRPRRVRHVPRRLDERGAAAAALDAQAQRAR